MKANTYHLWTIGCQMNESDAWRAAALLERAGWRPVEHARDAQFLLLSTCVVRQQAEDKILSRLRYVEELKREEPSRTVALMGCFVGVRAEAKGELKERFPFVDLFLPPSEPEGLERWLEARAEGEGSGELPPPLPESRAGGRTVSAHLPVVLGCFHACAYCIIPYRRGPERSRPAEGVRAEARALAGRGVRELVLLGQIIDRYGLDLGEGAMRLPELLRRVAGIPGVRRVRFLTSHPNWITEELVETVAETPGLMPYFEIPVQAGSDAVLAAMRRGYTVARYEAQKNRNSFRRRHLHAIPARGRCYRRVFRIFKFRFRTACSVPPITLRSSSVMSGATSISMALMLVRAVWAFVIASARCWASIAPTNCPALAPIALTMTVTRPSAKFALALSSSDSSR